ncbi:MAG: hypothetical protein P4L99_02045 [Chthoniobacter sp.]|nr:hypothetical protein [Chthoniobacter sp.]
MNRLRLCGALLLLCGVVASCSGEVRSVKTNGIEGVIVGEQTAQGWGAKVTGAQGFWTPSPQDVAAAENQLRAALEKGVKDPATIMPGPFSELSRKFSKEEIASVLEHYKEYRRQYIGVVIRGKRYVFLNSFSAHESMHEKERFVLVMDGGYWFWHVLYSVEDGSFSALMVNGSA